MNTYDPEYTPEKSCAILGAKTIVYDSENNILVLRRSKECQRAGGWDFPGGGIDMGEDPYQGALREITEESGITVEKPIIIDVWSTIDTKGQYTVILGFMAKAVTTEVTLSWEHDHYEWMSVDAVQKLVWPESHAQLLRTFTLR